MSSASTPASHGKKNIILILTDQQRTTQWFPPGWEERHLPAMTFLKEHGMTFTESVNNTCACTPSRTSIFTGTYPTRNDSNFTLTEFYQPGRGVTATPYNIPPDNDPSTPLPGPYPLGLSASENELDITLPNLATLLAEAGYETFYKGKYHLSKGVLGYNNLYYNPDITRYGFQQWDPPDAGQDAQIPNYGGDADNDGRFTNDAVAFLHDRVDHPEKYPKPFCLVFSLVNPHDVLGYPANWQSPTNNGGYGPQDLEGHIGLPPTIDENLTSNYKPTSQQNWLDLMNLQGPLQGPQLKNYLNFYGNLLSAADGQIMQLLEVLKQPKGVALWKDTMIIRTSDHGEMGLTHSGQRQKWFNVYEESIKVPLVWSNPELFPHRMESKSLVSLVDLLPTLASFCGVRDLARFGMQGRDYSALFAHPQGKVQDFTYFINTDIKAGQGIQQAALPPNNIAMVRNAQYKYALYYGGVDPSQPVPVQEEFYDLVAEAHSPSGEALELHNKSEWAIHKGAPWKVTPEQEKMRAELKRLLAAAMNGGVLTPHNRPIAPVAMKPRAKEVTCAWGTSLTNTDQVYQVIFYSQRTYTYTLQIFANGAWSDVPSTTTLIATTLAGNNGPILFQAQPKLSTQPTYRVARTSSTGEVTYEDVVWTDYTEA